MPQTRYLLPNDYAKMAKDLRDQWVVVDVMPRSGQPPKPAEPKTAVPSLPPPVPPVEHGDPLAIDANLDAERDRLGLKRVKGETREQLLARVREAQKGEVKP